jgi:hypothetical protein
VIADSPDSQDAIALGFLAEGNEMEFFVTRAIMGDKTLSRFILVSFLMERSMFGKPLTEST